MTKEKDELIKARVSADMKRRLAAIAEDKGETISVVVREAINFYLDSRQQSDSMLLNEGRRRGKDKSGGSYR
jgi:predicted DNA-binding protein